VVVLILEMRGRKMDEQGAYPYIGLIPATKGRSTPQQTVRVGKGYLKRTDTNAWKKKRSKNKASKRARKRNR